jgi:hypothetical protein
VGKVVSYDVSSLTARSAGAKLREALIPDCPDRVGAERRRPRLYGRPKRGVLGIRHALGGCGLQSTSR